MGHRRLHLAPLSLERWADRSPMVLGAEQGPILSDERLARLRKTFEEIDAKRRAGKELLPTRVP